MSHELFTYNLVRRDKKGKGILYMNVTEKIHRFDKVFSVLGKGIKHGDIEYTGKKNNMGCRIYRKGWMEFEYSPGVDARYHTEDFQEGVIRITRNENGKIIRVKENP